MTQESGSGEMRATRFRGGWIGLLVAQLLLFDFGRPIINHFVHMPRGWPPLGDLVHITSAVLTPMILFVLLWHATRDKPAVRFGWQGIAVIVLIALSSIGQGAHLSADAIEGRIAMRGYDAAVYPWEQPEVQSLPDPFVESFELVYLYDEWIGHWLWYAPLFLLMLLHSHHTLCRPTEADGEGGEADSGSAGGDRIGPVALFVGLPLLAIFWWYAGIEGKVWPGVVGLSVILLGMRLAGIGSGRRWDPNGRFLAYSLFGASVLTITWFALYGGQQPGFWEVYLGRTPLPF